MRPAATAPLLLSSLLFSLLITATFCPARGEPIMARHNIDKYIKRMDEVRDVMVPSSIFQEMMWHVLSIYAPINAPSELCRNHSGLYQDEYLNGKVWAVKMFDASTKVNDGMYDGNFQGLGSYDECLSVDDASGQFQGQLCIVETRNFLPKLTPAPNTTEYSLLPIFNMDIVMAVCVPSTCSAEDVQVHISGVVRDFNASAVLNKRSCSTRTSLEYSTADWVAIYVLAVLGLLIILSTCYDVSCTKYMYKGTYILKAFSIPLNIKNLLRINRSSDSINVIYGLRFLSICWIVIGHRYEVGFTVPTQSLVIVEEYLKAWWMSPILNMRLGVETFFLLSGLLVCYNFMKSTKSGKDFSIIKYYVHRYIRLTPSLAMVMLMEASLMYHMSEGPLWKRIVGFCKDSCISNWWSNLLYISNYVNPYRVCVLQSWYLSADMQLYFLSPLLLIPLHKKPRLGLQLILICFIATITASFSNAYIRQLPAGAAVTIDRKTERNHEYEYVVTHVRAASWLLGFALGYLIYNIKQGLLKINLSKFTIICGWLCAVCLCSAAVFTVTKFQQPEYKYDPFVDSLYIALHRPVFSLGVAWVILASVLGKGGFVSSVLSWKALQPLATLTYGIYLCHLGLQIVDISTIRSSFYFSGFVLISQFFSDIIKATIAAVILYVAVEGPFVEIDRWIFSKAPPKDTSSSSSVQLDLAVEKSRL